MTRFLDNFTTLGTPYFYKDLRIGVTTPCYVIEHRHLYFIQTKDRNFWVRKVDPGYLLTPRNRKNERVYE